MNTLLLSKLENLMPTFSKGQKRIAGYMIEHYDKAAFMTAARLGVTVGVSESTVVRFATELEFEGYPQLQKALQEMIRSKLTTLQRMEITSNRIGSEDVLKSVLSFDIDRIKYTIEEISRDDFNGAVDVIDGARRVYIIGIRSAEALAVFLGYYFNLILDNTIQIKTTSETAIFEQMLRINKDDVVIGMSFPRYSRRVVKSLCFAKDRGAKVVSITDSKESPLAQMADYVLLARSDMASFVDSLVAPLSLINALIVAVAMRREEEVALCFKELEHIWEEYEVYEKAEDRE